MADFPVVLIAEPDLYVVYEEYSKTYPKAATICRAGEVPAAFEKGLERIIANAYKSLIMILSHTCDIERRQFIAVAPLFPLSSVTNAERRRSIMKYKVNYRFYLPRYHNLIEDSYVDFVIINTVKPDIVPVDKRILSLDEHGRSLLVDSLYRYFCRPVLPEMP